MIYPLAVCCISFISGSFLALLADYSASKYLMILIFVLLAVFLCLNLIRKNNNKALMLLLSLIFFLAAVFRTGFYSYNRLDYIDDFYGNEVTINGVISEKDDNIYVKASEINNKKIKYYMKFFVPLNEKIDCSAGDEVTVTGKLYGYHDSSYYGDFNSKKYNLSKSVYGIIYYTDIKIIKSNPDFFYKLRNKISKNIDRRFYDKKGAFLKALLIGDKSDFSDELKDSLMHSGLSHIAVVSGMHLSIIISFIGIYASFVRKRKVLYTLIMMLALGFFLRLIGNQPSILRAVIMCGYCLVAVCLNKRYDSFTALMFSGALLILINPFIVQSVSFQLSYVATLAIIIASWKKGNNVFFTTLSILLLTLPLCLFYFNFASLSVFFTNLIASPIIVILLPLGYLMQILPFLHYIVGALVDLLFLIIDAFSAAGILNITASVPTVLFIFAMYFSFASLYSLVLFKRKKSASILLVLSIVLVFTDLVLPKENITVFNSGENVVHLTTKNDKNIICTSDVNYAKDYIITKDIDVVDAVILTKFPKRDDFSDINVLKVYAPKVLNKTFKGDFSVRYYDTEDIIIDGVTISPVSYAPYMTKSDDKKAVLLIDNGTNTILFEPYYNNEMNNKYLSDIKADILVGNQYFGDFKTVIGNGLQCPENVIYYNTDICGSVNVFDRKIKTFR